MKKQISLVFAIAALVANVTFLNCEKEDPGPDNNAEIERVTTLLTSGNWKVSQLMVDGVDETDLFPGLQLTFTATGFTSVNGEPVWAASGLWEFTNDATEFFRNDGVVVRIVEITDAVLVLSLEWEETTLAGGREKPVGGSHVFTFGK